VGWYHSHPGYGCWMSGIDCSTQMLNQQYQEPWLAVIIDPIRTCAAGKVEIGAFRTYPEGYKPPEQGPAEYQTIPLSKIEDFGVHAEQYYTLDVSFFKSGLDAAMLDLLWNKYWVNTLSSSPLVGNRAFVAGQVADLADKLEQADAAAHHGGGASGGLGALGGGARRGGRAGAGTGEEGPLAKVTRDAAVASLEQTKGLATQVIKNMLFNFTPAGRAGDIPMTEAAEA
jgi:COP9 signalosome complex subunit 5